jgi:hypothetical protein
MIEKIVGLEKLSMFQCQNLAKKIGFDSATFNLCGPKGQIPCIWLDAYMGIFATKDDPDHFMMVSQFQYNSDVWCTDLMPSKERK